MGKKQKGKILTGGWTGTTLKQQRGTFLLGVKGKKSINSVTQGLRQGKVRISRVKPSSPVTNLNPKKKKQQNQQRGRRIIFGLGGGAKVLGGEQISSGSLSCGCPRPFPNSKTHGECGTGRANKTGPEVIRGLGDWVVIKPHCERSHSGQEAKEQPGGEWKKNGRKGKERRRRGGQMVECRPPQKTRQKGKITAWLGPPNEINKRQAALHRGRGKLGVQRSKRGNSVLGGRMEKKKKHNDCTANGLTGGHLRKGKR